MAGLHRSWWFSAMLGRQHAAIDPAATGLSADRIQIVADGGGLFPDRTPDAFYLFTYSAPEPATGALLAGGLLAAWAVRRRRRHQ
jgi:hypothetical protein